MKRTAARLAVAFSLLNLPFWLLGHWYFIDRPRLNLDLFLPLLLAALHLGWATVCLLILWSLDLAVSESLTYHFQSPLDFLHAAAHVSDLGWRDYVDAGNLTLAAVFTVCLWLAFRLTPTHRVPWVAALMLMVVIEVLDVSNGSSMLSHRSVRIVATNVSTSPSASLAVRLLRATQPTPDRVLPPEASATGLAQLQALPPAQSAVLVLVESWGVHRDPRIEQWLVDRLVLPGGGRVTVSLRTKIPFLGPTTAAELRELCGLQGSYARLDDPAARNCLPARLSRAGWHTVGLHGFSPWMFDRKAWWPRTGLQRMLFAPDLLGPDEPLCGSAFAGACDEAVIAAAFREAEAPRTFVYALTLNSHLPLAPAPVPRELLELCTQTRTGDGVCSLTAALGRALHAVGQNLADAAHPLTVVVVGDHAPPFALLSDREQYDPGHVPAVILQVGGHPSAVDR